MGLLALLLFVSNSFIGIAGKITLLAGLKGRAGTLSCAEVPARARPGVEGLALPEQFLTAAVGPCFVVPVLGGPAGLGVGDEHSSSGDDWALGPCAGGGVHGPTDVVDWADFCAEAHGPPPFLGEGVGVLGGLSPISTSSIISRT